jgi:2-dehydropantoate 2-reductase
VPVAASDDPADLGPQDYVFVSVKATGLATVARTLAPLLSPDTAVITAQNGIPWWFFHDFGPAPGLQLDAVDPDGALDAAIPAERVI